MEKYIQRALVGPSIFEVLFGALASLLLGVVLAFAWLVSSGETSMNLPTEGARINPIPFAEGTATPPGNRNWERKQQAFLEGQSGQLAFTEAELNAWSSSAQLPTDTPVDPLISTGRLNFRIQDGMLQVATPATVTVLGRKLEGVLQSRGGFVATEVGLRFEPRETYFGSLAVHRFPNLHRWLLGRVSRQPLVPEDVLGGWTRVNRAAIEGDFLTVTIP